MNNPDIHKALLEMNKRIELDEKSPFYPKEK